MLMIAPISDGTLNVVVVKRASNDAGECARQSCDDDQRVGPALEIYDHEQVHQNDRPRNPIPNLRKALSMFSTSPRKMI